MGVQTVYERSARRNGRIRAAFLVLALVLGVLPFIAAQRAEGTPATDANPNLAPSCGLDVTLILDHSGSIDSTEAQLVRNGAQAFASALIGTPSRLKTVVFSDRAQGVNASGALTYNLNDIVFRDPALYTAPTTGAGSGSTNWDDGLEVARRSNGGPGQLVVFLTDGDPTRRNTNTPNGHSNDGTHSISGNGTTTSTADLTHAVTEADLIKATGAHMFGVGIGLTGADSKARLKAVTGDEEMTITNGIPTPRFADADFIVTEDFSALESVVAAFVRELCGHTLNVTKYLQKADGTTVKADAATPWEFTASFATQPPAIWHNPVRPDHSTTGSLTSNGNGGVSFVWDSGSDDHDHVATLTETAQSGWTYNGAKCTLNDFSGKPQQTIFDTVGTNTPGSAGDIADLAAIHIYSNKAVNCSVYNREIRSSTISVAKTTVPANTAGNFDFTLTPADGPTRSITGLSHGEAASFGSVMPGTYSLSETPVPGFTNTSATCDDLITPIRESVSPIDLAVGEGERWRCTFVNTADPGTITVVKNVVGADGTFGFTSNLPGLGSFSLTTSSGTASTAPVTVPVGHYVVTESNPAPWTLSGATCSNGSSPSDIKVGPGEDIVCTFTNTAPAPSMKVTKVASPTSVLAPGDPVTFTVTLINTSVEALTITSLVDSVDGGTPYDITAVGGRVSATTCGLLIGSTLPVGGSASCTFTVDVTGPGGATVVDTVTATAQNPAGEKAVASDDAKVRIISVAPSIAVTKVASVQTIAEPGGPVSYAVGIVNTGRLPVTIDSMVDSVNGSAPIDVTTVAGPITSTTCDTVVGMVLGAGVSTTCTFTYLYTDISVADLADGIIHDTVTVTGHDDDDNPVDDSAHAEVTVIDVLPAVTVTKAANPVSVPETAPGQTRTITYTVTITNDAPEQATIVSIVDSVEGGPAIDVTGTCAALIGRILEPAETVTCSFTGEVSGAAGDTVHDTVTATVSDDEGNKASDSDTAEVTFTDVPSSLDVTKTADPASVPENGGIVTYTVTIENTSQTDTVVIDSIRDSVDGAEPVAVEGECAALIGASLAPGQKVSCTFVAEVTGNAGDEVTDVVTVEGTDDDGENVSDEDDETVVVTDLPSSITVEKVADVGSVPEPGGPVTYTLQITNTSAADSVTIDSITDSVDGGPAVDVGGSCAGLIGTVLAPSQTVLCTFVAQVTGNAGDEVTDVVTVEGTDDDGQPVVADDDETVEITDVPPSGSVTKTGSTDVVPESGGTVRFDVVVTNTSVEPVTITAIIDEVGGVSYDVTIVGGPITATTCEIGVVLDPGATHACHFDFVVAPGKAGDVVNDIIRVTIADDDGNTEELTDDETVERTEEPGEPTVPDDVGSDQIQREPQQPARPSQDLPRTGVDVARLALIGMLLTAAGIVIARRWRVERS